MPRTDTASRLISAPAGEVFSALIDPEALSSWLPPGDMVGTIQEFEPWPGGSFKMVLRHPAGRGLPGKTTPDEDAFDARFLEVDPGVRVVFAVRFLSADAAFDDTMFMRWELTKTAEGTLVEITADNVPDAISAEDHAAGMESSLEQLARYVSG